MLKDQKDIMEALQLGEVDKMTEQLNEVYVEGVDECDDKEKAVMISRGPRTCATTALFGTFFPLS